MQGIAAFALVILTACSSNKSVEPPVRDTHSFSNPHQVRVAHVELDLETVFEQRVLRGSATLSLSRTDSKAPLLLDTRDLEISRVESSLTQQGSFQPTRYELGAKDPILGSALTIHLEEKSAFVRIHYSTSPSSTALQWLEPAQTAGKKRPFLYTQSQAIHARSWIPLQDSPSVRVTYRARVRTPRDLIALMSARADFRLANRNEPPSGDYTFRMPHAIPSYLIALAVGDLDSRYLGYRTGVWAEPSVVEKAAKEFEDTERMIQATEKQFGPYTWLRYDILVLPPSFPFGGMENPLMTFATPTILAGDKSLVSLVAHELAHSWSGNLVSNATWRDFWLNEGFTVYVERRILGAVYGERRAVMEASLARQELEREMAGLSPKDQILHIDLEGRDPDDGFTQVPYEKGALFLTALEQAVGRDRFDHFLAAYFHKFQFQSITTKVFRDFLEKNLLASNPQAAAKVPVDEWITQPGIPASAPRFISDDFQAVEAAARSWQSGQAPAATSGMKEWNTHQWLHFLRVFPDTTTSATLARLDRAFAFSKSSNSEILFQWLLMSVRANHSVEKKLEEFLTTVGRRKFLKPLYEELVKTPAGRKKAETIFSIAKAGYHPIAAASIAAIFAKPHRQP